MCPQRTVTSNELTSFIGRTREIADVRKLLSVARLITLTGVGGVGKTRLARRVACEVRDEFADGAWFVDLARASEPALLATIIADTLGVPDQSAGSTEAALIEYLANRKLLLILDNCEHLLQACAALVHEILQEAETITILATSRESLGVLGEYSWPVPPLSMPDLANVAPSRGGYVYGHEALDLFEERARAVRPGFTLDSESRGVAAQLCQRLDGLPLAIELAAVRLRALSIEQIVTRLEDRYRLLCTGNRGGPARHQTLRAAVDWSFDLCSEREKTMWARLSVFAGAFDLVDAEEVCAGVGIAREEVFELLSDLIDKSIVLREGTDEAPRYRLLETIKAYGRQKLAVAGGDVVLRRKHRDHYLRLAERSESGWFGSEQALWCLRLRNAQANFWAALDFCLTTAGEALTGLRMAGALIFYWNACGHLKDGRYWLERTLNAAPAPSPEKVKALWVNGYIAMTQGDNESAMRSFDDCVELAGQLEDPVARAFCLQFRGSAEQFKGNLTEAETLLADAVDFHRGRGALNSLTVLATAQLAFVSCLIGKADRAVALCEECRAVSAIHGEQWALSWAHWVLGLARWTLGDYEPAALALNQSLVAKRALDDNLGMSACVELLAWVAFEEGDAKRACRLFGAAVALWASVGHPLFGSAELLAIHDRYEERVRGTLGSRAYERFHVQGQQMTLDEVMSFACAQTAPPDAEPRLTRRENQVAGLIAEGLSNKQIAARLVISQRTAEGHVENVLAKLGFQSRAQVAAWFAGRD
ncbi:AAA family ATPase [Amycolatopsis sp. K13G38]|uniref:AAA family ATPase n=1 Tax=Amycolatopsis acididurans TaxID=2724524 RepID=A0ABX1J7D6_9PSEU|nr:LuxR C-terminal-related transcriptional regulator [Amycolatopsis acididurans]NKQ55489.1 AAA family ATPase [Amycolatopsis acididurans]